MAHIAFTTPWVSHFPHFNSSSSVLAGMYFQKEDDGIISSTAEHSAPSNFDEICTPENQALITIMPELFLSPPVRLFHSQSALGQEHLISHSQEFYPYLHFLSKEQLSL